MMGILFAPRAEVDRRLALCRACPLVERIGNTKVLRCGRCHCVVALKVRARGEQCPAGKW
jgi:hypothetical protein